MIFIRRSSETFHNNTHYDEYVKLGEKMQKTVELENNIKDMRDRVSEAMHNLIFNMYDRERKLKAKKIRQKAYHLSNYIYEIAIFEQSKEKNSEWINLLNKDIFNRKKLNMYYEETKSMMDFLNNIIKEELDKVIDNADFMSKLCIANPPLYSLISQCGKPKRKSHYVTLLKYLYKQETCCTPSSLWSGIAFCGTTPLLKREIWGEFNRTLLKHKFRNKIIDQWDKSEKTSPMLRVFVNPTLLIVGEFYLMFQFFYESIKKIQVKSNVYIDVLYKEYRKKTFTIESLQHQYPMFQYNIVIELIRCDILRIESPLPYGESGMQTISSVTKDDGFDNHNIRFENIIFVDNIEAKILHDAKQAFALYRQIYDTFFKDSYFGIDYIRLKDYLKKTGKQSLLEFLYSDFRFELRKLEKGTGRKKRQWYSSKLQQHIFLEFISRIKQKVEHSKDMEVLYLKSSDFSDMIFQPLKNKRESIEVIFQYDAKAACVIPEMLSLSVGRFLGRYGRFFPELKSELYSEILNSENVQVNIEINSPKDNISYDNQYCKKRIILYDLDKRCEQNSELLYTMEDIFIKLENDEIILCDAKNEKIKINCASTLSPSYSKIYQLFSYLTNIDNMNAPLGGTACTRLELDLNYQPRIIMDNLLISRRRWRVRKEKLQFSSANDKEMSMLRWKAQNKLPDEFYIYTDSVLKPYYCRLGTKLDFTIFNSLISNADKYVFFEEVYPNYLSNQQIISYNMEVMCQICLN